VQWILSRQGLGNFEFITERNDKGAIFMGSTHSGASTPQWATIEDSAKEYLTTSSGEGGVDHLSPRRCDLTLGTERVMMLDFTSTQALAKELAPPVH
jgi:hypothetical protein